MNLPILPTTVVGSYSMPGWLERLKTEFFARRISRHELDEIHDAATKAAIKDQEVAGLDIISDGELRRDNMVDYFAERLPGVQTDHGSKKFYYDFYDSVVRGKLPIASLRLVDDYRFLAALTDRATKFCVTGPHTLVKRIRDEHYKNEEALATDIARVMNFELKELVRAGVRHIQIDEPYYSGFPEDFPWGVRVLNTLVDGVDAKITLHVCYGNRYGKPSWAGNYRYLFPTILEARIHGVTLEFARRGGEDLQLFKEFPNKLELGVGVIDVKGHEVETPDLVAERIRKALQYVPAERLFVLPDCGCLHLPQDVAFNKLKSMVQGTRIVRKEVGG
ncbi:MAG: methionine synthase [Acidobacteria bacterium]|nr:MAG: methionine synthase [Acidobacteriota bacterium]